MFAFSEVSHDAVRRDLSSHSLPRSQTIRGAPFPLRPRFTPKELPPTEEPQIEDEVLCFSSHSERAHVRNSRGLKDFCQHSFGGHGWGKHGPSLWQWELLAHTLAGQEQR